MDQNSKLPYEPHPYAELFPLDEGPPLWAMSDQMKEDGFDERYKIVLFQGKILDGRRRQLAAHRADVVPLYEEFDGDDESALRFVKRANLNRRHLSKTDAALIAAKIADLQKGRPEKNASQEAFSGGDEEGPRFSEATGVSQAKAAEIMGVSRSSVQRARQVLQAGEEVLKAVQKGEVTLKQAAEIAKQINKTVRSKKPSKNGKSKSSKQPLLVNVFNDTQVDKALDRLACLIEARGRAFGESEGLHACNAKLDLLTVEWLAWAGKPAPEHEIIPEELDTPEFREEWAAWKKHRKEKKQPMTPTCRDRQLRFLEELGLEGALASLALSMKQGYTGLFPPEQKRTSEPKASTPAMTAAEAAVFNRQQRKKAGIA
jgi:predicted DNA-binding protein (UPF0251 family)